MLVEVPELERRKEHLDLISPTHPLLQVALDCLKDKEDQRPTAEQLCSRLIALKGSAAYRDSLQGTPEETTGQAPTARDQELEQQLRESESRVENLTREVQQLTLLNEEQARSIQCMQQEKLALQRENEQVVAALQQSVEQKDAALQAKDELLQEKEREIRELQQRVREREGRGAATRPLKLEWRDGPTLPFATFGNSIAIQGDIAYLSDGASDTKVVIFNSTTGQWATLAKCPKNYFSLAIVNGLLTAIGGKFVDQATNTLLSLSDQRWTEVHPPMTHSRNNPAVATPNTSLIVAGGWKGYTEKVTVVDIPSLHWATVASLPRPLFEATVAICGDRLYFGGGANSCGWNKWVVMCEVKDLLQSNNDPRQSLRKLLHFQ